MSVVHWHDFDRDHLRQSLLRWSAGGLFICAAHAAVVYGALFMRPAPEPDAAPAAVMIELAPLPVSAPSTVEEVAPGPQMVAAPETVRDAPDRPEETAAPSEPVERQALEEKTPEPVPEPQPAPAPQAVAQDMPPTPPSPVPAEVALPMPKPDVLKEDAETPPKAAQARKPDTQKAAREEKPEPKKRERKKEREEKAARSTRAPTTSAAPRAQTAPARQSAAPTRGASASSTVSRASWAAQVSAHLNRFKRYPPGARGAAGRPSVRFALSGSGAVTSVSLSRSSGNAALDAEALATVRRASPFPRPPDGRGASFSVPVNFVGR